MEQMETKALIRMEGLTCPACERKIEKTLSRMQGVREVSVSYATCTAEVLYAPDETTLEEMHRAIEAAGYSVLLDEQEEAPSNLNLLLIGLIVAGLFIIVNNTIGFDFFPTVTQNMGYGMLLVVGLLTSFHCIAMCGGINLSQCSGCSGCGQRSIAEKLKPSFLYNLGRVCSYTMLGGIVGALGSVLSVSLQAKSFIYLIAGIFMVIMGLNMLGKFSVLRRLIPRLPKSLTNRLDSSMQGKTPFLVGLLNGFMPCGPLQSMQLYALGTGSFFAGALSMFLFSIGTVPLMFLFGAASTLISARFTKQIMNVSAVLIVILGVVMGGRGLLVAGINVQDLVLAPMGLGSTQSEQAVRSVMQDGYQTVTMNLESGRYQEIIVEEGVPVKWTIVAEKGKLNGCNNEIIIPSYGVEQKLELGETVIEFTPTKKGPVSYSCWMGMITSKITVV